MGKIKNLKITYLTLMILLIGSTLFVTNLKASSLEGLDTSSANNSSDINPTVENVSSVQGLGSAAYQKWTGYVNSKSGLNVRTKAWGTITRVLKYNEKVSVIGKSGDWYKISDASTTRYVFAKYISRSKASTSASTYKSWTGYVNSKEGLNVRSKAWGTIKGVLKYKQTVTITGKSGDWYKIKYSSKTCYIFAKYITKGKPAATSSSWTGYVNSTVGLNVRSKAWGTIVGKLTHAQKVTVTGKSGDWYTIKYSGQTRFVHSSYIVKSKPSSSSSSSSGSGGKNWGGKPTDSGWISSEYGWRTHPITGKRTFHNGIDVACGRGTPIRSLGPGKVIFAGWSGGYGNLIKVQHDNGYVTYYAHLKSFNVSNGQRVGQKTKLGEVNSTGSSTGNHLHFEVRKNGKSLNPRNVSGVSF